MYIACLEATYFDIKIQIAMQKRVLMCHDMIMFSLHFLSMILQTAKMYTPQPAGIFQEINKNRKKDWFSCLFVFRVEKDTILIYAPAPPNQVHENKFFGNHNIK